MAGKMIKQTKIIQPDTGEIVLDATERLEAFMYKEGRGYLFINNQNKVYSLVNPGLPSAVSLNDTSYLTLLSRHLDSNNMLLSPKHGQLPMTTDQMAGTIRISVRRTYDFIKRMIAAGVMVKADGVYYINPLYFTRSRYLSADTFRIFRNELDPHIPEWAKRRYRL